jgi:hypothetical protein
VAWQTGRLREAISAHGHTAPVGGDITAVVTLDITGAGLTYSASGSAVTIPM